MASQLAANEPRGNTRLGSIPRLSAKFGSLADRFRRRAVTPDLPWRLERGSIPWRPTKKGPVVQLAEAAGSKSVESGFESQQGHQS